jgi:hypothetical protein
MGQNQRTADLSALPKGFYIVNVQNAKGKASLKLILQ